MLTEKNIIQNEWGIQVNFTIPSLYNSFAPKIIVYIY